MKLLQKLTKEDIVNDGIIPFLAVIFTAFAITGFIFFMIFLESLNVNYQPLENGDLGSLEIFFIITFFIVWFISGAIGSVISGLIDKHQKNHTVKILNNFEDRYNRVFIGFAALFFALKDYKQFKEYKKMVEKMFTK